MTKYVLITAAKNEEQYIAYTLESILSQSLKPEKWIIVSDGSTDRTPSIVRKYSDQADYIKLLELSPNRKRDFASKVYALRAGQELLKNQEYDFIGIIDADMSLPENYYESIIQRMLQDPEIGIGGGIVFDVIKGKPNRFYYDLETVGGQVQFFRKECFDQIEGYRPLEYGGEDATAELMAKMRKWQVRTFSEIEVLHHRVTGSGMWRSWSLRYYHGVEDYLLGYHPVFFFLKAISRYKFRPFAISSILMVSGFLSCYLKRKPITLPPDVVAFRRQEQVKKLKRKIGVLPFECNSQTD